MREAHRRHGGKRQRQRPGDRHEQKRQEEKDRSRGGCDDLDGNAAAIDRRRRFGDPRCSKEANVSLTAHTTVISPWRKGAVRSSARA